jgi:outer membrane protein OmpA-like peptidoglycan-associated protein
MNRSFHSRIWKTTVAAVAGASLVGCATASLPPALSAARAAHTQIQHEPPSMIDQGELERANQSLSFAEAESQRDPTTWMAADSSYIAQRRMETVLVHTRQHQLDAHRAQLEQTMNQGQPPGGAAMIAQGPPMPSGPTVIQTSPPQQQPTVIVTGQQAAPPIQIQQDDSRVNALTTQIQQLQKEIEKDRQAEKDRLNEQKQAEELAQGRENQTKLDDAKKLIQQQQEAALHAKEAQLADTQKKLDAERIARQQAETLSRVGQVRQDARGMIVSIPGGTLFGKGKTSLLSSGKQTLDDVADALKGPNKRPISVEAYTDSRGSLTENERLSQRRAQAVREYLVGAGVPDDLVTARGMGPASPIADNGTSAGRATNRRIELVVANAAPPAAASPADSGSR